MKFRVAAPLWKERTVPVGHEVPGSYAHCIQHSNMSLSEAWSIRNSICNISTADIISVVFGETIMFNMTFITSFTSSYCVILKY